MLLLTDLPPETLEAVYDHLYEAVARDAAADCSASGGSGSSYYAWCLTLKLVRFMPFAAPGWSVDDFSG